MLTDSSRMLGISNCVLILGALMTLFGTLGNIYFGSAKAQEDQRKTDQKIQESKARAAEAHELANTERAERLKLDAEIKGRVLSEAQQREIAEALLVFPNQRADIGLTSQGEEAVDLSRYLESTLKKAHWNVAFNMLAVGWSQDKIFRGSWSK